MTVTEQDRNRAMLVVAHLPISLGDYRTRDLHAARDVIAQALADERARAQKAARVCTCGGDHAPYCPAYGPPDPEAQP